MNICKILYLNWLFVNGIKIKPLFYWNLCFTDSDSDSDSDNDNDNDDDDDNNNNNTYDADDRNNNGYTCSNKMNISIVAAST